MYFFFAVLSNNIFNICLPFKTTSVLWKFENSDCQIEMSLNIKWPYQGYKSPIKLCNSVLHKKKLKIQTTAMVARKPNLDCVPSTNNGKARNELSEVREVRIPISLSDKPTFLKWIEIKGKIHPIPVIKSKIRM